MNFREKHQIPRKPTMGRIRVTIVAVKTVSIKYYQCSYFSLSYLTYKSPHITYILLTVSCLALLHVSTLFNKRHDFREKLLNIPCVLLFSIKLRSETSLSKKYSMRYYRGFTYVFM
jgi:hypothetical protein